MASMEFTTERVAAVFHVPPHLVDGKRRRFWRLRAWWFRRGF